MFDKKEGSLDIIRNPYDWQTDHKHSFWSSSSFRSESCAESKKSDSSADEDQIDDFLMKKFKMVRRHSCHCTFWGQENVSKFRKGKETMVLKQQYLAQIKSVKKGFSESSNQSSSVMSIDYSIAKSSLNVRYSKLLIVAAIIFIIEISSTAKQ